VRQQCVHRRGPRSGGTADGIADADDAAADVPAGQRLFFIVLHRASLAHQPLTDHLEDQQLGKAAAVEERAERAAAGQARR